MRDRVVPALRTSYLVGGPHLARGARQNRRHPDGRAWIEVEGFMFALCVGMYRACSTWQYGVVGSILERRRLGHRLGFVEGILFHEKVRSRPSREGWSILKAHDAHPCFGELLTNRAALGFYSYRDLRDVVPSYMHKTGIDFDTLIERGFLELCLENDRFWRAQPGVLIQRYDDLIADPVRGVAEVAAHLGVDLVTGEAREIADSLSWEANKRKVDAMTEMLRGSGAELAASDQSRFDPESLLHWNHIRRTGERAETGSTSADTPSRRRIIEQVCGAWLAGHHFPDIVTVPAAGPRPIPPALRTSYAPQGVDVRLDRLFRGTKGTILEFDAFLPRIANSSYFFYERGWRTTTIGTTAAGRDRFVPERPTDLHLATGFVAPGDESDPAGFAARTMADLAVSRRIAPPDVLIFNPPSDVDRLLPAVGTLGWRPTAVVVDQPWSSGAGAPPAWPSLLTGLGYLAVPGLDGPRIYLRPDRAGAIPVLAGPLGPDDRYRAAQWSEEDLAALAAVERSALESRRPVPETPAPPAWPHGVFTANPPTRPGR